jgi:hypothetical protein
MSDPTNASWRDALSRYDSLSGPTWHHIPAFRELVSFIAHSTEASGLTAITSHETLVVSPYTKYPDWCEGRHIRVHPLPNGEVRLDRCPERFDRGPTETWTVPIEQARSQILRLLAEL